MRSTDLGSADSTSTIMGAMEGVLLGCSDIEIKNNSVGKTKFTSYRYQLGGSRDIARRNLTDSRQVSSDNWNFTGDG